jgi:hypothetical protein
MTSNSYVDEFSVCGEIGMTLPSQKEGNYKNLTH